MGGFKWSHMPYVRYTKTLLEILSVSRIEKLSMSDHSHRLIQVRYPGMMKYAICINVFPIFYKAWGVMSGWMSPEVLQRSILLTEEQSVHSEVVKKFIGLDILPTKYGGKAQMPGCPNLGIADLTLRSSVLGNAKGWRRYSFCRGRKVQRKSSQ